jgi:hypothetical protein
MQTSWRAYGGINRQDRSEDINVNILSANYFTLRNSYQGLFGVSGDVVVTGDVTGEANLGVRGSVDVSNCVDISNNLWVHNFAHVHQELYLGDSSGETGLPYLYGLGWDSSASIGINNSAPLAALDISGSNSQSLHVYTSSQTSRNIIARNVNAHGIVSSASDGSSALIFYNTTPIPSLTDASGDAAILYTASGDLTFSAPHSVNIWSKAIVDPKYTGVHILEETLVVGDVSCGVYEPSLFRNADFSTGRALSLVSDNSWSNTVLSVITPGALGAALVGGAYPLDTARSMASMGVYAAPGGSGAVFVPAAAAVLGASAVRRRVCLGVNTGAPRVRDARQRSRAHHELRSRACLGCIL